VIEVAAAELTTSPASDFLRKNEAALSKIANVPDNTWRDESHGVEGPYHFFQWDNYSSTPIGSSLESYALGQVLQRLTPDFVKENGSAPWRSEQVYGMLVQALRAHDAVKTLQFAGILGHYVGDMSQPMHATSDYDGQSIGKHGIHHNFESALVDQLSTDELMNNALRAGEPIRQSLDAAAGGDGEGGAFVRSQVIAEAKIAYGDLQHLLDDYSSRPVDEEDLKSAFGPLMGRGAAVLSQVWDAAVRESGVTSFPNKAYNVAKPAWFPLGDQAQSNW